MMFTHKLVFDGNVANMKKYESQHQEALIFVLETDLACTVV